MASRKRVPLESREITRGGLAPLLDPCWRVVRDKAVLDLTIDGRFGRNTSDIGTEPGFAQRETGA